jgi:hypothetical protein
MVTEHNPKRAGYKFNLGTPPWPVNETDVTGSGVFGALFVFAVLLLPWDIRESPLYPTIKAPDTDTAGTFRIP